MKEKVGVNIQYAIELLSSEELVSIPTETVYGLAANALSEKAVAKVFSVKKRPFFDPLIVHVSSKKKIEDYAKNIPDVAFKLAEKFMPGPLTLVLEKNPIIPDLVTSGFSTVALRVPNHFLTQKLLSQIEFPLAAPSANPFGYISPTKPTHVEKMLGNDISYILDGGGTTVGIESTIVCFDKEDVILLRKGGITLDKIENEIDKKVYLKSNSESILAPGMLKSHYSPLKKLFLCDIDNDFQYFNNQKIGALCFSKKRNFISNKNQFILSKEGSILEAASNLFSGLHYLDDLDIDIILAENVPNIGVGIAINDRLLKASG